MKTLIVDDNKENLYLLEAILKGSGYEVTSAANGAEALEKLRAEGFGMIISDILMPVMDGFQLCREVKGDEELKDIPFVFYTATYTDEKDEELALKMGADKFIRKPMEPDKFIKLIQGVIRDAEKGKVEPKKPVLEEKKEAFKLYSERLVKKLEKKMLDLEREITERKQAEEKAREVQTLRELDRLRSGLLANVSHELRTPLTSIKGFATTLLRSDVKWSEEEQQDFLQSIDQETDRLIRLISDLLDMSRIEAKGLKLEKDNYQISEILDLVGSTLASLTEHHQLQVIVPPGLPSVFVDQMRIGQVLTNLIENATRYSGEGSQITIEAQLVGDQIIVSVTDRGEGIPTELLDKVFDRFYQAEGIVTGRKSGTGLGLSICRGIIEAHGGRIWVESKPGEGSRFSFSLPVGKGEEEVD